MMNGSSGVDRLEERIDALVERVEDLEKKLATVSDLNTFFYCPRCGGNRQFTRTGKILTSMPPQTEVECVGCGLTRGIQ
jgi:transcription elongation factor Elf1